MDITVAGKIVDSTAKLAEALRDNPAAEQMIALFFWFALFMFLYGVIKLTFRASPHTVSEFNP